MNGMFVIGFPDVVEPLVLALVVAAIMCVTLCQMLLTSVCCRDVASKQDMLIVALSLCYAFLRLLSPSFTPTSLPHLHTHLSPPPLSPTLSLSTSLLLPSFLFFLLLSLSSPSSPSYFPATPLLPPLLPPLSLLSLLFPLLPPVLPPPLSLLSLLSPLLLPSRQQ